LIWRCDLTPQYLAYEQEIDEAIKRVLRSGRYILAEEVALFEAEFAAYVGVPHAVGVANGTDGLILALRALGVGPGDEVVTTPFTAIPTVSAIVATGAVPVFADVDPATFLIDVDKAAMAVTPRTKAIMPVHIFGNVVDIPALRDRVGKIPIVEDAAQAHGSLLGNVKAGAMGDLGVFSFYPTKNVGGYGDGGLVTTHDADLAERLRRLRMYGMTDKDHIGFHGVNSRLDELQAAILRVKLRHLDDMNERRRALAQRYFAGLDPERFVAQHVPEGVTPNYHVFVMRCRWGRAELIEELDRQGIQTNIYYPVALHLQEANKTLGLAPGSMPMAEQLCLEAIALPFYPEMPIEIQDLVITAINESAGARDRPASPAAS
jgi:dTDP-4-amino-4,6-dideoxygalactose transaminase